MAITTVDELQVVIQANADQLKRELQATQRQLDNTSKVAARASKGVSTAMIALGTAIGQIAVKAIQKFISSLSDSVQICQQASASMTKLATVMAQRGATQAQYNEIIKLTNAEQELGVVSASAMQNGLQELATYVGKAESLKQLTGVMNNLIVQQHGYDASEYNALQTATMMGKVLQGQTGGMERIGYHLTENEKKLFNYGTEEERVALLTEIVNDNLGDLNHALGATPVGKQKQLANTWADCKAQLGALITTIKNAFAPAISLIIKGFSLAIAYVSKFLSLFGINVSSGAESLATAAGSAEDVADGLDDATDSAKKLKKQLASFDEMNVLNDKTDSSSGSEGTDILAGLNPGAPIDWGNLIPDIELPESWQRVAEEVKNFIKGFDFSKIGKALQKFGSDVGKALKPVMKILGDLWEYLKPLVYWVGNDLLPAFLNALGGAIQFIGSVLGVVWETLLKPFIDSFLVPIAQWTGGIIVDVLNGIGDALRFISENIQVITPWLQIISDIITTIAEGLNNLYVQHIQPFLSSVGKGLVDTFSKFTAVWKEHIQPFIDRFIEGVRQLWDEHLKPLWDKITEFFGAVADMLKALWENVIKPFVDWFVENILPAIVPILEGLWNVVKTVFGAIADIIGNIISIFKGFIDFLTGVFSGDWEKAWDGIKGIFEGIWNTICSIFKGIWDTLCSIVGNALNIIGNVISTVFNAIKDTIQNIWNAIWNIIKGVLNAIIGGVEGFCNLIINALNLLIKPLADIGNTILSIIGINDFKFSAIPNVSLPRLAKGGIVTDSILANIGESGKEAVLPLENNTGWMDELAEKINKSDQPMYITVKVGEKEVASTIIETINDLTQLGNRCVINV